MSPCSAPSVPGLTLLTGATLIATFVQNPNFPSGHSMMAAMVYLTLGILLARTQPKRRVRTFIVAISIAITVLVGASRVYLGVHWPTDVLAGWTLGGAWAMLFWLVAMKVDPPRGREE